MAIGVLLLYGMVKARCKRGSLFKRLLKKVDKKVRADKAKNEKILFGIVDSKSIKTLIPLRKKDMTPGKNVGNKIAYYC